MWGDFILTRRLRPIPTRFYRSAGGARVVADAWRGGPEKGMSSCVSDGGFWHTRYVGEDELAAHDFTDARRRLRASIFCSTRPVERNRAGRLGRPHAGASSS